VEVAVESQMIMKKEKSLVQNHQEARRIAQRRSREGG
jgi:hypothetical protein